MPEPDTGTGVIVEVTFKDGGLEKKVKLPFSLCGPEMFAITLTKEAIYDLVDLINRMD